MNLNYGKPTFRWNARFHVFFTALMNANYARLHIFQIVTNHTYFFQLHE